MVATRRIKTKQGVKVSSRVDDIVIPNGNVAKSNSLNFKSAEEFARIIYQHFDSFQKLQNDISPRSGKQKSKKTLGNKFCLDENMVRSCASRLRDELSANEVTFQLEDTELEEKNDDKNQKELIIEKKKLRQNIIIETLGHIINASLTCGVENEQDQKISNQSIKKTQENYEYVMEQTWSFLAIFLQLLEDDNIKNDITDKLVQLSRRISVETIRGRCVVALGYLSYMVQPSQNSDRNFKTVIESLQMRLQDKSQTVRLSSVKAVGQWCQRHKQTIIDHHYDVIEALLHVMARDSSPAIRLAVLEEMKYLPNPDDNVLSTVMNRIRDTKIKVRLGAINFLKINANCALKHLSVEECVHLLKYGLNKRCSQTHDATSQLLCCGMMKVFKFNPLALLNHFEPTYNEDICEQVAQTVVNAALHSKLILKELSNPEIQAYKEQVLDNKMFENLWINMDTSEIRCSSDFDYSNIIDTTKILYLRVRCKILQDVRERNKTADTQLSEILPDIPSICNVLKVHLHKLNDSVANDFVEGQGNGNDESDTQVAVSSLCLQLLRLAELCDLKEEGSRRHLASLLHSILVTSKMPDDVLELCVMILSASHDTESQFVQAISEVLADINTSHMYNEEGLSIEPEETNEKTEDTTIQLLKQVRTIAILSIVLENVSTRVSTNPILKTIASTYIEPAITHANALVREAGVGCLGKFTILMMQNPTVINDTKILLVQVAYNKKERMETRAQAILALTDLALINDSILSPVELASLSLSFDEENDLEGLNPPKRKNRSLRSTRRREDSKSDESEEKDLTSVCLVSLLLDMVNDLNNPALRVVAAECCAKLMFSGKVHDANLAAELIVIYFDRDFVFTEDDADRDDAKEVGSPVRLQQLLTLFFPAYCFRSRKGRDTLMASIKPVLSIVCKRKHQRVRGKRAYVWPIIRMIEYICNNVERAEDQAMEEKEAASKQPEEGETEKQDSGHEEKTRDDVSATSPVLLLSISISEFLTENASDLTLSFMRSLCKILHGVNLDLESENIDSLNQLVKNMDDLSMIITDASAIRSLEKLLDMLSKIPSLDEMAMDEIPRREDVPAFHSNFDTEVNQRKRSIVSTDMHNLQGQEGNSNEDVDNSESRKNTEYEGDKSEDDFYDENNASLALYDVDKENSIYATLADALTPIKKKSRSSQSPLKIEPEFSPPKNKRKTYSPVKSATKPRATVRRRKELSDLN